MTTTCQPINAVLDILTKTKDAEAAVEDSSFKKISRAAFTKCQSLWNEQSISTQASDTIKDKLGCMLVVPNVTLQWNVIEFYI